MLYNSKTKAMPAGLSPSMNVHRVRRLLDVERLNYCTRCYCVQLLDMLKFYTGFEISDQTGNALTQKEMTTLHYDRITSLQVTHLTHTHTHTHISLSGVPHSFGGSWKIKEKWCRTHLSAALLRSFVWQPQMHFHCKSSVLSIIVICI